MSRDDRFWLSLWGVLAVGFASLTALAAWPDLTPYYSGDNTVFSTIAQKNSIWSSGFWGANRPITYPLLHKLCGLKPGRLVVAQLALSILGHGALAFAAFWGLGRRAAGLALAGAIFLFAYAPEVNAWTRVIRSESISFSLTAATITGLAWLIHELGREPFRPRRTGAVLALAWLVLFLLAFSRDNWAWLCPLVACFLAAPVLRPSAWRKGERLRLGLRATSAAAVMAIFVASQISVKAGDRWRTGLSNAIFLWVLPDPVRRERWQNDYGMPVDADVMRFAKKYEWDMGRAIKKHKAFQTWLNERGTRTYATDLVRDRTWIFTTAKYQYGRFADSYSFGYTGRRIATPATAVQAGRVLHFRVGKSVWLVMFANVILAAIAAVLLSGTRRSFAIATLLFAVAIPAQTIIVTLADSAEIARHAMPVTLGLRLAFWLSTGCLLASVEVAVKQMIERRAVKVVEPTEAATAEPPPPGSTPDTTPNPRAPRGSRRRSA